MKKFIILSAISILVMLGVACEPAANSNSTYNNVNRSNMTNILNEAENENNNISNYPENSKDDANKFENISDKTGDPPSNDRANYDVGNNKGNTSVTPRQTATPTATPTPEQIETEEDKIEEGQFPFPPPKATNFITLKRSSITNKSGGTSFNDVSKKLVEALEKGGYDQENYGFFSYRNDEFALVTRMERIDNEGNLYNESSRWVKGTDYSMLPPARSPGEYFKYLFSGKKIFYRVFAFVVSKRNKYRFRKGSPPSFNTAKNWVIEGTPVLSRTKTGSTTVQQTMFSDDYDCSVLIYLFVDHTSLDDAKSVGELGENESELVEELRMGVRRHLEKANIVF